MDAEESLELGFIDSIEDVEGDNSSVAMNAMQCQKFVKYDLSLLADKLNKMREKNMNVCHLLKCARSLSQIEKIAKKHMKISNSEVTAIVSAVSRISSGDHEKPSESHGDHEPQAIINMLNNFKIGE